MQIEMNTATNDTGAIERPRLWRLALQVDVDSLRVVMWSTVEDSSLRQFVLPLDPTLPLNKALEEAIYAAPVLLSDFAAVDVVVRTTAFMPVPSGMDADLQQRLVEYEGIVDNMPMTVVKCDTIAGTDIDMLWTLDADTARFLARTFRNPPVVCHLTPLLRYFCNKSVLGNSGKLYAHFHQSASQRMVDIIVFGADGRVAMATTHACPTDEDALYYILASAKECGLDITSDEILLCGNGAARDALMPLLRRYAAYVMPVIFPSAAFRAGREALNAPFPLVILPLCE